MKLCGVISAERENILLRHFISHKVLMPLKFKRKIGPEMREKPTMSTFQQQKTGFSASLFGYIMIAALVAIYKMILSL